MGYASCDDWLQVDLVKLLMDKLMRLHRKYVDTPLAAQFPRPAFKVGLLQCLITWVTSQLGGVGLKPNSRTLLLISTASSHQLQSRA